MKKFNIKRYMCYLLSATLVFAALMPSVFATELKVSNDDTVSANTVAQTSSSTSSYVNPWAPGDYLYDAYEKWIANRIKFDEIIKASIFADENGIATKEACVSHENIKYAQDHAEYVAKANEICAGLTDDTAKAEAMYKWIATNMFHDKFYESRKDIYSPLAGYMPNGATSAWNRGGGVCFDMSAIYMIMCHSQNIPAVIVCSTTHAWNAIYVNDTWYQVDCDADCNNKAFTEDLSDLTTAEMSYEKFELYDTVGFSFWGGHTPSGVYNLNSTPEEIAAAIKLAREVRGLDNADDNSTTNNDDNNITDDEDDVIPPAIPTQPTTPSTPVVDDEDDVIPPYIPPTDPGANNNDGPSVEKPAVNDVQEVKSQKITCKVTKKTYKKSSLKKKSKSFYIKAKAKTKVTYKVSKYPKGGKKYIKVNSKGKVTIKKGAKKGTYKITVTAKKTSKYKKATKTVTIKVK